MRASRSALIAPALLIIAVTALAAQQPTPAPAPAPAAAPAPAPAAAPAMAPATMAPAAAPAMAPAAAAMAAAKPAATAAAATEFQRRLADYLLRGITLSPEQKTKLESLMASHHSDRAVFGTAAPDSAAMVARVQMVRKHMAENRAVLTEDQQKIYDRNVEQLRELLAP